MNFYYLTDIGKKRKTNQDTVAGNIISEDLAWSIVCDGMGGNNGGDIASSMATRGISELINRNLDILNNPQETKNFMKYCIDCANYAIYSESQQNEQLSGMGTTIVFVIRNKNQVHIAHAGDSRAYILSQENNNIYRATTDHSIVQELLDKGEITEQEARNHARKNIITRALGVNSEIKFDYNLLNIDSKSIILSCTDGLTNYLEDHEIYNIYKKNIDNLEKLPKILIDEANNLGGHDNITVSVII